VRTEAVTFISKLVEISEPVSRKPVDDVSFTDYTSQLSSLYSRMDGLVAFEGALLVLPTCTSHDVPSIYDWNEAMNWRSTYDLPDDILFFAMDLFAEQFGITAQGVYRMRLETGELEFHSKSVDAWAKRILSNYNEETGYAAGHAWQVKHGALQLGYRLVGRKPFVLGGEYVAENLVPLPALEAARQMGKLYMQISTVHDGHDVIVQGWLVK